MAIFDQVSPDRAAQAALFARNLLAVFHRANESNTTASAICLGEIMFSGLFIVGGDYAEVIAQLLWDHRTFDEHGLDCNS